MDYISFIELYINDGTSGLVRSKTPDPNKYDLLDYFCMDRDIGYFIASGYSMSEWIIYHMVKTRQENQE